MISASDILAARILVVDDLVANVLLLEQMLRGAGYTRVASTRDLRTGDMHTWPLVGRTTEASG
jgi:adenylate cyclase